jgi:hypothetical protein
MNPFQERPRPRCSAFAGARCGEPSPDYLAAVARALTLGAFLAICAVIPRPADGDWFIGTKLLLACEGTVYDQLVCIGYIQGVSDTLLIGQKEYPGSMPCAPAGTTGEQLRLIVIKALHAEPERLHYAAFGLVQGALLRAFPCHG